jgi:anti-sigma-K factor RskA
LPFLKPTFQRERRMSQYSNDKCIELEPQLAALALGEAEMDGALRAHVQTCRHCQEQLRSYAQVAHALASEAPQVEPPPGLRERIVATIRQPGPRTEPPPVRARRPRAVWRLVYGLAAALLVALLVWNIALQQQLDAARRQVAAGRASWQQMTTLLNSADVRSYPLEGGAASGHFWASPQQPVGCLVVQGLPGLPEDQVYQVWLAQEARHVSGGVFETREGNGWVLVKTDGSPAAYDSVLVTIEPRGGSAVPSGPPVLNGPLIAGRLPAASERALALRQLAPGGRVEVLAPVDD